MATEVDAIVPPPHTPPPPNPYGTGAAVRRRAGRIGHRLDVLRAAGWTTYEDELANKTLLSSDGGVTCEVGPETDRYANNRRTVLRQVTFTHCDPKRASGWSGMFGNEVRQAITPFLAALTDPAGQRADHDHT
jgi:hypothetical protein